MPDKVFSVTRNKVSSLIIDENSLKFLSKTYNTHADFKNAWSKKLTLATKSEIKYHTIRAIKKEDNDSTIAVKYKTFAGITGSYEFAFKDKADNEEFFNFFDKERYFTRTNEVLTPFKAVTNYAIGLVATIGFTIFSYYQAVGIANGTVDESGSSRTRLFYFLLEKLGANGVIAVGGLIACLLLYKIWMRFTNPPNQTKLLPPGV